MNLVGGGPDTTSTRAHGELIHFFNSFRWRCCFALGRSDHGADRLLILFLCQWVWLMRTLGLAPPCSRLGLDIAMLKPTHSNFMRTTSRQKIQVVTSLRR